ncbi:MAG: phosphoadenosine phosphosulfate reductase family protein [Crenarchaeota archaeon]|nr:phosphoadenosine phosphosulfate reductase family protein [Thermoproteota archaeon]
MSALPSTESPLKIYYVPEENLYFFKKSIAERYGTPQDVTTRFRFWADPRPLIPDDISSLRSIANVDRDFVEKIVRIVKKCTTIVNVVNDPNLDLTREFMVNGELICTINYDIWRKEHIMILNKIGTALYVEDGYRYVKVEEDPSEIDGQKISGDEYEVLPIVNKDRNIVGSCIIVNGRARVVRKWRPVTVEECLQAIDRKLRTPRELYEANLPFIEERRQKIRRAVEYFEKKHGLKGVLSFSGGKDSLLALLLLIDAESNAEITHVSIENADPPTLCSYIDYIEKRLSINVVRIESRWDRTRELVELLNVPSRGNRWCTPLLKFVPLLTYLKKKYNIKKIISYVGSRKSETVKRRIRPATYIDSEAGLLTHAVCYKFPKLLEYLYIWYGARIRMFDDYLHGIERLSCVICPFKSCLELEKCEKKYPETFQIWRPYIEKLTRIMIKREEDLENAIKIHLWRFFMLHCEAQYIAARAGVKIEDPYCYQRRSIENSVEILSIERRDDTIGIVLRAKMPKTGSIQDLINNISTFYENTKIFESDRKLEIHTEDLSIMLDLDNSVVYSRSRDPDKLVNILKIVFMSLFCIKCGHCTVNCDRDCIELPYRIRKELCDRCGHCLDSCVPYRIIFDMVIYAQLTSIRKARERLEGIREKYKEILIKMRMESGLEWLRW